MSDFIAVKAALGLSRQGPSAVYDQVRAFVEVTDGQTAKLSRMQKGRFVATCWIGQILKHFRTPSCPKELRSNE